LFRGPFPLLAGSDGGNVPTLQADPSKADSHEKLPKSVYP